MDKKQIILELLQKEAHLVIATVGENTTPEAAFIGFSQTDDLILIIGTSKKTRKYKNIMRNSRVAVVIGGWAKLVTIQYEGEAIELTGEEQKKLTELYFTKVPEAKKYNSEPDQTYFKIIPKWIRCTGYSEEERVFEITF